MFGANRDQQAAIGSFATGTGPVGFLGARWLGDEAANAIPNANPIYMSREQRALQDRVTDNAMNARRETEESVNSAIDRSANAFTPYDSKMSGALTNRYRSALARKFGDVRTANATRGFESGSKALGAATQLANQRVEIENENLRRLRAAEQAKEAARSQVLGSILGLTGMGVGIAAGSGAASRRQAQPESYQYEESGYAASPNAGYNDTISRTG